MNEAAPSVGDLIVVKRKEADDIRGLVAHVTAPWGGIAPRAHFIRIKDGTTVHVRRDGADWIDAYEYTAPKRAVDDGWTALVDAGAFRYGRMAKLESWLRRNYGVSASNFLTEAEAALATASLKQWLNRCRDQATQPIEHNGTKPEAHPAISRIPPKAGSGLPHPKG